MGDFTESYLDVTVQPFARFGIFLDVDCLVYLENGFNSEERRYAKATVHLGAIGQ